MKIVKGIAIVFAAYVGLVVAFETMIGVMQPQTDTTLVITTTADDGTKNDRVLAHLEHEGRLYVAANHWPRAWYEAALANPEVDVTLASGKGAYTAVPVTGDEHREVDAANALGLGFRFLTGFPPRLLLRLDPRDAPAG